MFARSSSNAGALVGDNIYTTSVRGSGYALKCGLISVVNMRTIQMISTPTRRCIISAMPTLNSVNLMAFRFLRFHTLHPGVSAAAGSDCAIASNGTLSFNDPVATVSAKDKSNSVAISQLHISGTTSIR